MIKILYSVIIDNIQFAYIDAASRIQISFKSLKLVDN
jgi:hypothetical protein